EVDIRSASPATLAVTGALVFDSATRALRQADDLLKKTPHDTLDLAGVTVADSAGLACVLAVLAAARRRGGQLRVVNLPASLGALARACEVEPLLACPLPGRAGTARKKNA